MFLSAEILLWCKPHWAVFSMLEMRDMNVVNNNKLIMKYYKHYKHYIELSSVQSTSIHFFVVLLTIAPQDNAGMGKATMWL